MSRHVKLRHNPYASLARIRNHIPHLLLRIKLSTRCVARQLGKLLALSPEALIIAKMPMKNIELGDLHAVERPLDFANWFKVAHNIEHESPPSKARRIIDRHEWQRTRTILESDQLQQRLQATDRAYIRPGSDLYAAIGNMQLIALIFIEPLNRPTRISCLDRDRRAAAHRQRLCPQNSTALSIQSNQHPVQGPIQPRIATPRHCGMELLAQHKITLGSLH